MKRILSWIAQLGNLSDDDEDIRLQKSLLVFSSLMMASLGIVWSSIYFIYGEYLAGAIPLSYSALSFLSIASFALNRRYGFFRSSQLLLPLLLPFFLMMALGGFKNSSAVILWALTCPFGALLFVGRHEATKWFLAFIALVVISAFLDPYVERVSKLTPMMKTMFFAMNIIGTSVVAFFLLQYFVLQRNTSRDLLNREQEKSESLLLNILPKEIASILKNEPRTIADNFEGASILFADLVNFTPLSATLSPKELVEMLNQIFSQFDLLADQYDLEKIKTIGDCYMVASGVPRPQSDHAQKLVAMALDMQDFIAEHRFKGHKLSLRIGLNSGPVVAGVIGTKKFIYDLWGDAVNTASRMESHGQEGKIQITKTTYELIKNDFICESQGTKNIKGKGEMEIWHVVRKVIVPVG